MAGSYEGTRAPRHQMRTALWTLGVVVVLGVVVGATAAAGGFRAAPPAPVPVARVGTPVRNGELVITTNAARYRRTDPLESFTKRRGRYIVVLFHVTNVSQRTVGTDDMGPANIAITGRPAGTTISAYDSEFAVGRGHHDELQPSMPQPVLMVGKLPTNAPVPRELALTIYRAEYASGFIDPTKSWRPTKSIAARVTVPVRRAR